MPTHNLIPKASDVTEMEYGGHAKIPEIACLSLSADRHDK